MTFSLTMRIASVNANNVASLLQTWPPCFCWLFWSAGHQEDSFLQSSARHGNKEDVAGGKWMLTNARR